MTQQPTNQTYEAAFNRIIEDADPKQLEKSIDFGQHRFVSIERDALTSNRYAKGHKTLRGACSYLARVVEEGEPMVPESVLDLSTGQQHEVDLFVHVAPRSVDAVSVLLPRSLARTVLCELEPAQGPIPEELAPAHKLLQQAIDRR